MILALLSSISLLSPSMTVWILSRASFSSFFLSWMLFNSSSAPDLLSSIPAFSSSFATIFSFTDVIRSLKEAMLLSADLICSSKILISASSFVLVEPVSLIEFLVSSISFSRVLICSCISSYSERIFSNFSFSPFKSFVTISSFPSVSLSTPSLRSLSRRKKLTSSFFRSSFFLR